MQLFFVIWAAFCPSHAKSASDGTGGGTPFMDSVDVLSSTINEHNPDTTQHTMNGRDVCKKHTNGCNCLGLDVDELHAAATELRTLANDATKAGFDVIVISVGGKQSDLYVKMAALNCPFFVGGTHASTWAVRYPTTWGLESAQIAASHK